jgi:uncharacterized protein
MEIDFLALARSIEDTQSGAQSDLHGPDHWRKVAVTGLALDAESPAADLDLVLLFALLHDSQRLNDGEDAQHPERAAAFAAKLDLGLSPERLSTLLFAIRHHTSGATHTDPTVAICWDADRLNLWRVGITPSPTFLSTVQARPRERILWAARLQEQSFQWADVLSQRQIAPALEI